MATEETLQIKPCYQIMQLTKHFAVLRSLGNFVASDSPISSILIPRRDVTDNVISALVKCLKSEHRVLKKEAAWVLSNIAAGSVEHKQLIYLSDAIPLLLRLLSTAPFDIRKEVAYVVGNLCVASGDSSGKPNIIVDHLVSLVGKGCLPGFIDLVRSADTEAARLGLQFIELVLRGMPNSEGPKLVEGRMELKPWKDTNFMKMKTSETWQMVWLTSTSGRTMGLMRVAETMNLHISLKCTSEMVLHFTSCLVSFQPIPIFLWNQCCT